MPAIRLENLSSFGRLALQLDTDFSELTRLSGQIQRLDIDSDSGLEHALKLLSQFAQHGQSINEAVQQFSQTLLEARTKSEEAAKIVGERAQEIQRRKEQQSVIRQKLAALEQSVKAANEHIAGFRHSGKGVTTDAERAEFKSELERLNEQMAGFIEVAQSVKEEAAGSKFRAIERDAQSIHSTLQSLQRKIESAIRAI